MHIEVHKTSKIYNQRTSEKVTFESVEQAKDFFLSAKAKKCYDDFCARQLWKLTPDKKALHWTIVFLLDPDSNDIPNSTLWRDTKEELRNRDEWRCLDNDWPIIEHDAKHLF